ncbi:MAG: hypothetical protein REH83_06770 [Rickettsiella sp.]|nr:hypothetical protein [Rickettsiella sp.]
MHNIKLVNGPTSRRGVCLKEVNKQTKQAINQLVVEIDIDFLSSVWHDLSNIPY